MNIGPKTKQRIYLFIEKEHGWASTQFLRLFVSICLLLLGTPKSLNVVVRNEILSGDFKTPVRRLNWLLRYSKIEKQLFQDDFFDFSLGLSHSAAKDMCLQIERRDEALQFQDHVHLAQLSSRVIESGLLPGETLAVSDDDTLQSYDQQYQSHLLKALSRIEISNQSPVREKNISEPKKDSRTEAKSSDAFSQSTLAQDVFVDTIDFMQQHQPGVYAVSGTLLGIIRENKLLSHDIDIDIGVMAEELNADQLIKAIEASSKFYIKKVDYPVFRNNTGDDVVYSRMAMPSLIKFGHKQGLHIDLFVHFDDKGVRWHGSSLHRWDNSEFEVVQTEFMGREVNIPSNPEQYLKENYGDWKTPKIDFNCSIDTPNIALQNSCKTICYFIKLLHFYHSDLEIRARILSLLRTQDVVIPENLH